jgi:hypothetical protein
LAYDASDLAWNRLLTQGTQAASSGRAKRRVQNGKLCFAFTGLCRYAGDSKKIHWLTREFHVEFHSKNRSRKIQRGIPSSTNEFTYNIPYLLAPRKKVFFVVPRPQF